MANIKDYLRKVMDGTVSLEEQQKALAQVEKTIQEQKQKRDEAVGKNAEMVIQALKTIESKLEAKLEELNNTPAKQGIQGPPGQDGKDGKDGKNGRDGINGKDGKDGVDGIDGQDGVSVVDAKIDFDGSLVIYLSNGNEIDAGQILQPEVAKNIIISSGGSGTSQVVTDTLVSLQNQINALTGIDGVLGTMAQQNDTTVDINGGSIDGTAIGANAASTGSFTTLNSTGGALNGTIGATTPATGTFTTITGQTEVLRGTGQNFLLQSQAFSTASWTKQTNVSATDNTVTAPDGTTTAATITWGSASNGTGIFGQRTGLSFTGITNTKSIYVRADVAGGTVELADPGQTIGITTLTLSTSWQRVTLTEAVQTTVAGVWVRKTASSPSTIYLWGGQLEIGSVANTYIPTTTTAIYGTPTLSFSGVSTLGLESNGALFLQPAGTGAIQAQATTSTTAGGNARGANAVDWQTARASAGQVASSSFGTVGGGSNNTASSSYATVNGGLGNTASGVVSFVGSGRQNTASGNRSAVVGGDTNTAAGQYNFIGAGFTNSGTSASAVTTQSGTMNGTTAVTLSGSNASIRVGQYITGTSIAADTYVAAISGTSLTLSQAASGSSTSTLSFFTPHGVVVGGGNNQATGAYSFIGGGGDAGTAANRNVASGDWSVVVGGIRHTASGLGSFIGGGGIISGTISPNTASAAASTIVGGLGNTASGFGTFIGGGGTNTANATYATVVGGVRGTTRAVVGYYALAACNVPIASVTGVSQTGLLILGRETTDATATILCSDANAAGTTNQVILPNNSAYYFKGSVIANVTGAANGAAWSIEGAIMRGANAASTVLIDTPSVNRVAASSGATAWTVAVTADTTNGGIAVTVTGAAGTTIRWVAKLETTEVTF